MGLGGQVKREKELELVCKKIIIKEKCILLAAMFQEKYISGKCVVADRCVFEAGCNSVAG